MNVITIAGQLGKDAELKNVGQDKVLIFSVADSQGKEKPAIWWRCNLWGKRAESLGQYLLKGQSITVSGVITEREYTDKDGITRKAQEVRVNDIALQGGKPQSTQAAKPAQASGFEDLESDIPF